MHYDHKHDESIVDFAALITGPRIAAARNQLVRLFLSHKDKPNWMLMLDADMVFQPTLLAQLLAHADPKEVPVIGGLCFVGGRGAEVSPTLHVITDKESLSTTVVSDYPRDTLVRVHGTGAACLLIHRSVLEKMGETFPEPAPWFFDGVWNGHEFGEDIAFCYRAGQVGFPVHVHTGIRVGHLKTTVIDEYAFDEYRDAIRDLGEELYTKQYYQRLGLAPVEQS